MVLGNDAGGISITSVPDPVQLVRQVGESVTDTGPIIPGDSDDADWTPDATGIANELFGGGSSSSDPVADYYGDADPGALEALASSPIVPLLGALAALVTVVTVVRG